MTDMAAIGLPPAAEKKIREAFEKFAPPFARFYGQSVALDAEMLASMPDSELRSVPYVGDKAIEAIRAWEEKQENGQIEGKELPVSELSSKVVPPFFSESARVGKEALPLVWDGLQKFRRQELLAQDILLALIEHGGKATPDMADNARAVAKRFYDAS